MGPVKQYTAEKVDQPDTIAIYPGADASFLLYEDDGKSFDYRKGAWTGVHMEWHDARAHVEPAACRRLAHAGDDAEEL